MNGVIHLAGNTFYFEPMTEFTRIGKDGSVSTGTVHPEVAEGSLACLKRDLRKLRQTNGKSFFRKPYIDLQEAQMIGINEGSPAIKDIAGILVVPIVQGDTNARLPMTIKQVREEIAKGDHIDLWSPKASNGFG